MLRHLGSDEKVAGRALAARTEVLLSAPCVEGAEARKASDLLPEPKRLMAYRALDGIDSFEALLLLETRHLAELGVPMGPAVKLRKNIQGLRMRGMI